MTTTKTTTITTTDRDALQRTESTVVAGLKAIEQRDALLVSMHRNGATLQSLADLLNDARRAAGGPLITRAAVFAAIKRHGK